MQIIDSNEILMKKFLPKSVNNPQGFTLIELLIVVSIVAILSVVAIALFSNVQADARDAKRKAELSAISNVLEVNKKSTGYQPIFYTEFGGNSFPGGTSPNQTNAQDPQNYAYCIAASSGVTNPAASEFTTTPQCTNASFVLIGGATPAADSASYKICTRLENRGNPLVYCTTNVQ